MDVDFQSRNYRLPISALRNLKLETRSWEGTEPSHLFSSILSYQLPQIGGLIAVPSFSMVRSIPGCWLGSHDTYVLLTFFVAGALGHIEKQDGLKIIHVWPKNHCTATRKDFWEKSHKIFISYPPLASLLPFTIMLERFYRCDLGLMQHWFRGEMGEGKILFRTTEYFLFNFVQECSQIFTFSI